LHVASIVLIITVGFLFHNTLKFVRSVRCCFRHHVPFFLMNEKVRFELSLRFVIFVNVVIAGVDN